MVRQLPDEPTEAMRAAGDALISYDLSLNGMHTSALGVWRRMVAQFRDDEANEVNQSKEIQWNEER